MYTCSLYLMNLRPHYHRIESFDDSFTTTCSMLNIRGSYGGPPIFFYLLALIFQPLFPCASLSLLTTACLSFLSRLNLFASSDSSSCRLLLPFDLVLQFFGVFLVTAAVPPLESGLCTWIKYYIITCRF